MKKFFFLLIFFSLIFTFPSQVSAITQFSSTYQVSYQVLSSGITHVKFDIQQTNNLSQVYATDYSLSLSQTQIDNVKVTDINKVITPNITQTQNLVNISFPFINKVVGKNKTHRFSIEYDTPDIASQNGGTWEINIPRLEPKEGIGQQVITLTVPTDFPEPAYINPAPNQTQGKTYTFSSYSLANQSISALFGTTQYYKLRLYYNLENTSARSLNKEISLPPDTGYQQVYLASINPQPSNINLDDDGNWLAQYQLKPKSEIQVYLEAFVKLNFQPQTALLPPQPFHTQSQTVWDYTNPAFSQSNLGNLTTPRSIYDYVTQILQYNYHLVDIDHVRPGATFSLQNPGQVICTEFTDLFIAMARQQQIPAREIQGFALSQNDKLRPLSLSQDVLHSWPEYYQSTTQTWVQVDPTWTNTTNGIDYFNKLDLNHITFVIHGQNPNYPPPAGAYKTPQSDSKDVFVDVVNPLDFPQPQIQAEIISHTPKKILLEFSNPGGVAFRSDASVESSLLPSDQSISLYLPPFSSQQISLPLSLQINSLFPSQTKLTITTPQQVIKLNHHLTLHLSPLIFLPLLLPLSYLFYHLIKKRRR